MKRLVPLLLLLVLTSLEAQAQLARYSTKFTLSKHNFVDSIAISYENGQVLVPVTIGKERLHFLLDTGAGQAVVYNDHPIRGCQPAGQIISHDAVGHVDTVKMVKMPPLQLGSVTYTGCQATIQQRRVRNPKIDGIIGFDLVCKGLQMKIDAHEGLLILTDRKRFFDQEEGFKTRYRLNFHVPYIVAKPFEDYAIRVLLDTGSPHLFTLNKRQFDEAEKKYPDVVSRQVEGRNEGHHAMGHQGAEERGEVIFLALQALDIAGYQLCDLHTTTTQGGSHIGARLLQYGSLIFSPRHRWLTFQPYNAGQRALIANTQAPIHFVVENGQTVVGLVWEKGSAYAAGFRSGDVILQRFVDGTYVVRDAQGQEKTIKWKMRRRLAPKADGASTDNPAEHPAM